MISLPPISGLAPGRPISASENIKSKQRPVSIQFFDHSIASLTTRPASNDLVTLEINGEYRRDTIKIHVAGNDHPFEDEVVLNCDKSFPALEGYILQLQRFAWLMSVSHSPSMNQKCI
jgi:hypothetical protein